jgi:hypothetical protein
MAEAAPTATPFPAGDPRNASFAATVAALTLGREQQEESDNRDMALAKASYQYNTGVNLRGEVQRVGANRNNANSQGLAESGTLAKTQGQTVEGYAQKEARLGEVRQNAINQYTEKQSNAAKTYNVGYAGALATSEEKGREEAEKNPPAPEGATPANPGATRTVTGAPGSGGVVPYVENLPNGGFVKIGQPQKPQIRQAAAKRAVG